MKAGVRKFGTADRRLLPEGRLAGPMPWVIAIMMFLTVLAAAAGLGLRHAAASLDADVASRLTVQVIEADPAARRRQAEAAIGVLRALPNVTDVRQVADAELARMLEPWLGDAGLVDIPVPALIDVGVSGEAGAAAQRIGAALAAVAPAARVDANAAWLLPLARLIDALEVLAIGLVVLMIVAAAATVVLAARASLDTHRGTIEVLHLMGAPDVQVARLFQRRIALDALFGGVVGLVLAGLVLLLIGDRLSAIQSELLGAAGLPWQSWLLIGLLPLGGVLLAMLVARTTILRALGRML